MRSMWRLSLLLIHFAVAAACAVGQEPCTFSLAGDWESVAPGERSPAIYRFASDATVTAFTISAGGREGTEIAKAGYRLDSSQSPKALELKPLPGGSTFPWGFGRMEIVNFADDSFTIVKPGSTPAAWARKEHDKYFVILAAHRGTPPHSGGPAFVALIKKPAGGEAEIETFGLYYREGQRINGPVPAQLHRPYLAGEPPPDQDAVLRLQVTAQQFSRATSIVRTWQRRAHDGALLFPSYSYLNVIVPLKEVAESLNACGDTVKLHKLTWMTDDELGANIAEWELSFRYVKRLRELNEQANVPHARLQGQLQGQIQGAPGGLGQSSAEK